MGQVLGILAGTLDGEGHLGPLQSITPPPLLFANFSTHDYNGVVPMVCPGTEDT